LGKRSGRPPLGNVLRARRHERTGQRRYMLLVKAILLRIRMSLGYIPNMEWFRVRLSRAVVLDRARAHAAIAELERCLTIARNGGHCSRFALHE
jgi:hypothetical protein